ncbi:MAG: BPSS1187 family protein [Planctomycetota bacterium]
MQLSIPVFFRSLLVAAAAAVTAATPAVTAAVLVAVAAGTGAPAVAAEPTRRVLTARASELDPRARPHPEIDFVFEKDGKPADLEHASVDTAVPARGRLLVWLMDHNAGLFERANALGLHALQPHYANKWFATVKPTDRLARGLVRLEAATGRDVSTQVAIPEADGMMERVRMFLAWLAREQPAAGWEQFLTADGTAVRWDKVVVAGSSHGATTAARFAMDVPVDRVVMLCGPRDQDQDWQAGPSATAKERFFGFSHVLDGGWSGDHYCRSWELLGLERFGPIVTVDDARPPFGHSRRLVSAADVGGDEKRAHSAVQPGKGSPRKADGSFLYEPVWEYLLTHPVEQVGAPTARDPGCRHDHPLGQ